MPAKKSYLVLSALGEDRPGIVAQLSKAIFDLECSINDSRMTVLGGEFAVAMMIEGNWNALAKLASNCPSLEQQLGLKIMTKQTKGRKQEAELLPYEVDLVALDHPGIVHHLANFFSRRKINIEELATSSYAAAHTGSAMFSVHIVVSIPADVHIASLREEFMEFCDTMNLDAVLEPIKL
ncbi:MAG: glycine cleavage system protein R [Chromatiaceae bacterium]|nr:glycine cleavage system protein R [Gammaproteobacteria bacterium]MCB1873671.1 glycine cleavage system protein R [Gammaproteobacteria bacterium]MCB1878923.1 glycine cleavage system protein R [Gammaproteobacteria bacterium]MCB1904177.1 glycine cleavage system protein R [Gammaproteobacteria bacterium]MCP5448129.1 glycine cleavage system protein R [Chromatiaceae bacterium]